MKQKRKWLVIGDLHLTDQARDAYRFGIFDWIVKQQDELCPAATFLAGDITDAKDRHSATLVNKIVAGLTKLSGTPIYICRGNHDYRDPANPFFKFLNHIEGLTFVTKPMVVHGMAIIPHVRTQDEFNAAVAAVGPNSAFLVHQTFDGAIAETGVRLTGLSASPIELLKPALGVYAGDVHRPQRQGIVTYVGCPYHVRFGDSFTPRSLWVTERHVNRYFDAPFKWSLTVRDECDIENDDLLSAGDQVKLTIEVAREELVDWKKIKANVLAACKDRQLEVYGVTLQVNNTASRQREPIRMGQTNEQILGSFCDAERLSAATREAGKRLFGEVKDGDENVL